MLRSREYSRAPRLTSEEETALVKRWQDEGDESARRRLVQANMRHVISTGRKFRDRVVNYEDLLSEGCLGLLLAIDKFDPDRGVRLVTYARYWIRAYVIRAMNKEWKRGKTGLGKLRWTSFFKARRTREVYVTRYGEDGVSLEEMAGELGMSASSLAEILDCPEIHDLSLDFHPASDSGNGLDLHERLASSGMGPEAMTSRKERLSCMAECIEHAMQELSERERLVVRSRLMDLEPMTLQELGDRLGISRERVRQIEVRVRQKLGRALSQGEFAVEAFV
jgi:RNA polymerase sigma-32 factor